MHLRLPLLSLLVMVGCGRTGLVEGAPAGLDGTVPPPPPPPSCTALKLLGTAELGPSGKDGFKPAIAGRGSTLGVAWRSEIKAGSQDLELRFAAFAAGMKPSTTSGAVLGISSAGPTGPLVSDPNGWAALLNADSKDPLSSTIGLLQFSDPRNAWARNVALYGVAMAYTLAASPGGGHAVLYSMTGKMGILHFASVSDTGSLNSLNIFQGGSFNDL